MTKEEMKASFPEYVQMLRMSEIKEKTIRKYVYDLERFLKFVPSPCSGNPEEITKEKLIAYKANLLSRYKPASVNSYLLSLNRYMIWSGNPGLKLKLERIQRRCSLNHVLEMEDYQKLLNYALRAGKIKYYYIMKTLSGTGIRVGELKYITREALETGVVSIRHKGKNREICIPEKLCRLLLRYCREQSITAGIIFTGRDGQSPLDESGVWKSFKRLANAAGVDPSKVYPHSFRHFFAKTYMREIGNLTELCDILGHSSVETTRIYTKESAKEKRDSLGRMNL